MPPCRPGLAPRSVARGPLRSGRVPVGRPGCVVARDSSSAYSCPLGRHKLKPHDNTHTTKQQNTHPAAFTAPVTAYTSSVVGSASAGSREAEDVWCRMRTRVVRTHRAQSNPRDNTHTHTHSDNFLDLRRVRTAARLGACGASTHVVESAPWTRRPRPSYLFARSCSALPAVGMYAVRCPFPS